MSWIKEIEKEDAQGELREIYDDIEKKRGKLSNIMKVHSLNPAAMKSHMDLYYSIMFKDRSLSREECEVIAVLVSKLNGCDYCITHHIEALSAYWKDEEKLDEFVEDFRNVEIDDKMITMLEFVEKLTSEPSTVGKEDIEKLRTSGFNDKAILNIDLVASYFNFVNRIAMGLGVEFTEEEASGYEY
ncbi:MAG: peroxidase-related enzyme [Thermoplasmatota archaeon]